MGEEKPQRNIRFDVLRTIALLCILIAHTSTRGVVWQIRNFDVPLFVMVAGSVFAGSYSRNRASYGRYFAARLMRLIGPTYLFVALFFASSFLLFRLAGKPWPFTASTVLASFTLTDAHGIGYLWVVRVFILVAAVAPLLAKMSGRIRNDWIYYGILAAAFFVYAVAHHSFPRFGNNIAGVIFGSLVYYIVPYGCVFGVGMRIRSARRRHAAFLALLIAIPLVVWGVRSFITLGGLPPLQKFKYPPQMPYVSYAAAVSCLLYCCIGEWRSRGRLIERLITFVGSSSLWIYLWHIYVIYIMKWGGGAVGYEDMRWPVQLVILGGVALAVTFVQKRAVTAVSGSPRVAPGVKKALRVLFLQ